MWYVASLEDIRAGRVTDVYFRRAVEVLRARDADKRVVMEVTASSLPAGHSWTVLGGVEEMVEILAGRPVDVWSAPEGSVFCAGEPVVRLAGRWCDFGEMETALLGVLCHGSGVVTKAARCKLAAGDRSLLSFGARRAHPALAPSIERSAYIGGCDGVAVVASAEALGLPASGTMPHALMLIAGSTETALLWFDEVMPPEVGRVALIDTFHDEKFAALEAAETLRDRLSAVRLDTPGSRRGDFHALAAEVRWELDLRGWRNVRIVVSGGLDEADILGLNDVVDGYGVGTAISDAPVINFAMDIVDIEGTPITKRGKKSGVKQTWVCWSCGARETLPVSVEPEPCPCGGARTALLQLLLVGGDLASDLPSVHEVRDHCLRQVADYVRLVPTADFR
jgi:nicotinate phosphoribosyltransferase